jgi:hypothetical protein
MTSVGETVWPNHANNLVVQEPVLPHMEGALRERLRYRSESGTFLGHNASGCVRAHAEFSGGYHPQEVQSH